MSVILRGKYVSKEIDAQFAEIRKRLPLKKEADNADIKNSCKDSKFYMHGCSE